MSIVYIITILVFITTVTFVFFELLYLYSKRSYLKELSDKKSIIKVNPLKSLAQKLHWSCGTILPKIFNYEHVETLLHKSGQPFQLTVHEFTTLHRLFGNTALFLIAFSLIFSDNIIQSIIIYTLIWLVIIYLPIMWLKVLASRRVRAFDYNFSTFIDMLSLTVNAGMNFESALFFTTDKFRGVIHEEFKLVQHELSYGYSLETALNNLSKKIDSIDLRRFVTAIKQAKKLGTPMSKALNIQSKLILTSRIQKAEELSRTASVKISIPLVFFIFPALLILYLVPALLQFMK